MNQVVKIVAAASAAATAASSGGCGNVGVCYDPFHLDSYPLTSSAKFNSTTFSADLDADFAAMSKYFTHVRTYYTRYYGVDITPFAAKYGIKLDLGVFTTWESWMDDQIDGAVQAINNYPDAVDTVLVGNENLYVGWTATRIVDIVNDIKNQTGSACGNVKFGTVQRFTEYVDSNYKEQIQYLDSNLDVLGVNLYPNMVDSYSGSDPTAVLDYQWNQVTSAVTASKVRLTEVGFPTAGDDIPAQSNPDSRASVEHAVSYYNAIVDWTPPTGDSSFPKFWFSMHDRRTDDTTQSAEYEHHFGFFTHDGEKKTDNFPLLAECASSSAASASSSSENSASTSTTSESGSQSAANTTSVTGSGSDVNTTSMTGSGSDVNTTSMTGSGSDVNTTSVTESGSDINTTSMTGSGSDVNTTSVTGSGSDINATSETGSGSDVNTTSVTGSGSDINTTSETGSGSDVNTTSKTGSGSDANTTSETGSGSDVNTTSETGSGSDVNTTSETGSGSNVNTTSVTGSGKKLCPDFQ